ncbi:MAG TPA: hypothetical protein DD979_09535 [Gammaproteobacteria bacterium]|jgi:outer membrane protein assembly factor BamA|nr:hypothetical protein [Gammaproteobacteria bacterium]
MVMSLFAVPAVAADKASSEEISGTELCQGRIDRVYFSGNETTRESTLRQELSISEGDDCVLKKVRQSRQNMMDLGLFSAVQASLTRYSDRLVLQFTVREKYFILPIPRLSRTSDGEIRLGGQLRIDNFSGRNHKLKITSERHAEDDGAGRKGFEHSFEYVVPRFSGSRFGMHVRLQRMDKQFELKRDGEVYGESNRLGDLAEVTLIRRRDKGAGSQGWLSKMGFRYERRGHDLSEGDLGPFEEGRNLTVAAGVVRNEVHLEKYRRRGFTLGGTATFGLRVLGADYKYQSLDLFYRGYKPLTDRKRLTNVNYNIELGYTNGTPFGERAYSIGGGESLRGLPTREIDGDVKMLVNLEYLEAFEKYPALRWVLFWDVANVFPRWDFKPVYTENGLGAGLRWKIVSFVRVDLRFDYAVSLSERRGYAYFGTQLNF